MPERPAEANHEVLISFTAPVICDISADVWTASHLIDSAIWRQLTGDPTSTEETCHMSDDETCCRPRLMYDSARLIQKVSRGINTEDPLS